MKALAIFSLLFSIGASEDVVLFDSSSITSDLNWQTFSTVVPKDVFDSPLGWIEESWLGRDQQSNIRIYGSCSESPVENGSNWVFVPPIEVARLGLKAINIELTYTIRDCRRDGILCKETVNMYMRQYQSPTDAKMFDAQRDFKVNSQWFNDVWKMGRVLTRATQEELETATFSLSLDPGAKYIQLAFDDNGACTSLLITKVFYSVCEASTLNFTSFPKTVWNGEKAEENVIITGRCVANATARSRESPVAFCTKPGYWHSRVVGSCECNPGFVGRNVTNSRGKAVQHCEACSVGTYKSEYGNGQCFACPPHTEATSIGSAHCTCLPGYYRSSGDPIASDCSQPPSRPTDLFVKFANQTSVELRWDEPSSFGGRKELWYEWQCARGDCSTVWAYPADKKLASRVLRIHGLKPDMDYVFNVFAKNKVSDLAGEAGVQYRAIDIHTSPMSGVTVHNIRVESETKNGIQISWDVMGPPSYPVTQYEVEVSAPAIGTSETRPTREPRLWFYDLRPDVVYMFKVRAFSDDWGSWSSPFSYQSGKEIAVVVGTASDIEPENSTIESLSIWLILLITVIVIILLAFILLLCRRNSKNRKQMSDLDVLDTYKQDTMTPDYGSGNRPLTDVFRTAKLNAPLMSTYGSPISQPPPYYGASNAPKFKPYVDPTAYEDPNQALIEFTFDIDPQHVFITQVIGGGEFGDVCMGGYIRNADIAVAHPGANQHVETVAIKTLKLGSSAKAKADFLLEASIMGQFNHPNVVRLIGVVTRSEPAMIVTEYMENGSLDYFLRAKDRRGEELGWVKVVEILRGIAAGMKYLTDKGYVHRDLAARNVLVDGQMNCKIADFGLSREVDDSVEQQYTTNGGKIPVRWTAPEAITHRKFTASSDVWSYGILMWEVCSFGERPYWDWTNQKVISEIMNGFRLPAPMDCPASLHRLMLWCWKLDRHDRPSFSHLLSVLDKYCSNPDYIYVDKNVTTVPKSIPSANTLNGTLSRPLIDMCPPPPQGSPPIYPQLNDFLQSLGLIHNLEKLQNAGIVTVGDLSRRHHLDLLAIGMLSEEWNRIRDALLKLQPSRVQSSHNEGFFV